MKSLCNASELLQVTTAQVGLVDRSTNSECFFHIKLHFSFIPIALGAVNIQALIRTLSQGTQSSQTK